MDNKPSFRTKKFELSIKRLVSEYLVTHRDYLTRFPSARFEITEVKVSKDFDRFTGNITLSHIKDVVETIDPVLQANQILLDHAKKNVSYKIRAKF